MTTPLIRLDVRPRKPIVLADPGPQKAEVYVAVSAPAAAPGVGVRRLNLALVIDRSGSMHNTVTGKRPDGKGGQVEYQVAKLDTAKAAAKQVLDRMDPADTFTLVVFNDQPEVVAGGLPVGPNRDAIKARIDALKPTGSTMLGKGLRLAVAQMTPHVRPGVNSTVYVLTDGNTHDEPDSLAFAPEVHRQGVSVYAGGIGDNKDPYKHAFLDGICADHSTPGALLVDHIDPGKIQNVASAFLGYLSRRGQVLTDNCRLVVEPLTPGLELLGGLAQEGRRALGFEPTNPFGPVPLPNLPPGGKALYQIELRKVFAVATSGRVPLAKVRVLYDLPAQGVTAAESSAVVEVEVTNNPDRTDGSIDKVADELFKELNVLARQEKADKDYAAGRITKEVIGRITRDTRKWYDAAGKPEIAEKYEEYAQVVEKADPKNPADTDKVAQKKRETQKYQQDNSTGPAAS